MSDYIKKAWAIQLELNKPNSYVGHGRFNWSHLDLFTGIFPIVIFSTRAIARKSLKEVKGPKEKGLYPKAKVVPVEISIKNLTICGNRRRMA